MYKFKPIKQLRVSEGVFKQLKQSILIGHFKPGDKLPTERQLSEDFQVSRVAVREAIRALESCGLVVTQLGATGGVYVTDLSLENLSKAFFDLFLAGKVSLEEMHRARLLIDPEVGRLAAQNVSPEFRQALLEALEVDTAPEEFEFGSISSRLRVHYILAEMCGNRFLEAMVELILGVSRKILEAFKTEPYPFHAPGSHVPIIEAVLAEDSEAAAEAMRRHAAEVSENLISVERAYRRKVGLEANE